MDCGQPMNRVIVDQVRALVASKRLGAEIVAAEQGMRIGMFLLLSFFFASPRSSKQLTLVYLHARDLNALILSNVK